MNFRQLRKSMGIEQKEIAKEIGVTPASVLFWEIGKAYPRTDKILKLEKMLGVPASDIIRALSESKLEGRQLIKVNRFSAEELQSIATFYQEKAAEIEKKLHYDVKRLAEDATYQKYLSIASKAGAKSLEMEFMEKKEQRRKTIEPGAEGERL